MTGRTLSNGLRVVISPRPEAALAALKLFAAELGRIAVALVGTAGALAA